MDEDQTDEKVTRNQEAPHLRNSIGRRLKGTDWLLAPRRGAPRVERARRISIKRFKRCRD